MLVHDQMYFWHDWSKIVPVSNFFQSFSEQKNANYLGLFLSFKVIYQWSSNNGPKIYSFTISFIVIIGSLLYLMHAIALAHASKRAPSPISATNSTHHFCLWHLLSRTLEQWKWKKKTSNLIVDYFSLTFVNLSLPCLHQSSSVSILEL